MVENDPFFKQQEEILRAARAAAKAQESLVRQAEIDAEENALHREMIASSAFAREVEESNRTAILRWQASGGKIFCRTIGCDSEKEVSVNKANWPWTCPNCEKENKKNERAHKMEQEMKKRKDGRAKKKAEEIEQIKDEHNKKADRSFIKIEVLAWLLYFGLLLSSMCAFWFSGRYALLSIFSVVLICSIKYVRRDGGHHASMLIEDISLIKSGYPVGGEFISRFAYMSKSIAIEFGKIFLAVVTCAAIGYIFVFVISGSGFQAEKVEHIDYFHKVALIFVPYYASSSLVLGIVHGICISWFWWWYSPASISYIPYKIHSLLTLARLGRRIDIRKADEIRLGVPKLEAEMENIKWFDDPAIDQAEKDEYSPSLKNIDISKEDAGGRGISKESEPDTFKWFDGPTTEKIEKKDRLPPPKNNSSKKTFRFGSKKEEGRSPWEDKM